VVYDDKNIKKVVDVFREKREVNLEKMKENDE
jgi:hypothetical protein